MDTNVKETFNTYDLESESYGIGYTKKGEKFYFDKEDYDKIKDYNWYINLGYVVSHSSKKEIRMHRLLMPTDKLVDHINHNKADNRKCNLRPVTIAQNGYNRKKSSHNTSGVNGVGYDNYYKKWRAYIGLNGKDIKLGFFKNIDDAVKARKEAEEKYFGEYSYDNSMKQNDQIKENKDGEVWEEKCSQ